MTAGRKVFWRQSLICFAAAISAPLFLVIAWHALNRWYPRNDPAAYIEQAQNIFMRYKTEGIFAGLHDAFWSRPSKPTLGLPLEGFFLALCGGDIRMCVVVFSIFYFMVFCLFVVLILREYLKPRLVVPIAILIGALPYVLHTAISGLMEGSFLAASAAAYFFLLKSRKFTDTRFSCLYGLSLALSVCFRPVEALATFAIPTFWGLRLTRREILAVVVCLGSAVLVFLTAAICGYDSVFPSIVLQLFGAIWPAWLIYKKSKQRQFLSAFLICYLIFVMWYTPFYQSLYDWIYSNNFSPESVITGRRSGQGVWQFVAILVAQLGGNSLYLLGALALATWVVSKRGTITTIFKSPVFYMVVAPVVLGALTTNGDPRYYYFGAVVLFGALGTYLLRGALSEFSEVMIYMLAAVNLIYAAGFIFNITGYMSDALYSIYRPSRIWPYTPWFLAPPREPDPVLPIIKEIQTAIVGRQRIGHLHVFGATVDQMDIALRPSVITVITREAGADIWFENPPDRSGPDRLRFLKQHYSYLFLVGPIDWKTPSLEPNSVFGAALASEIQKKGASRFGLKVVKEILATYGNGRHRLLLLKWEGT